MSVFQNAGAMPRLVCGLFLLLAAFAASPAGSASQPAASHEDRYRFNLGGQSGYFTDAEIYGIKGFRAVRTTIKVSEVHGKPRDKWAALVRINLLGVDAGGDRPMFSLVLQYDRKTRIPTAIVHRPSAKPGAIDIDLLGGVPIDLELETTGPGVVRVSFGDEHADVPIGFDVHDVQVVASGVDALLDPFVVRRAGAAVVEQADER